MLKELYEGKSNLFCFGKFGEQFTEVVNGIQTIQWNSFLRFFSFWILWLFIHHLLEKSYVSESDNPYSKPWSYHHKILTNYIIICATVSSCVKVEISNLWENIYLLEVFWVFNDLLFV